MEKQNKQRLQNEAKRREQDKKNAKAQEAVKLKQTKDKEKGKSEPLDLDQGQFRSRPKSMHTCVCARARGGYCCLYARSVCMLLVCDCSSSLDACIFRTVTHTPCPQHTHVPRVAFGAYAVQTTAQSARNRRKTVVAIGPNQTRKP